MQYTGMDVAAFRESFREQAEKQVKVRLALEYVVKVDKITVSDEQKKTREDDGSSEVFASMFPRRVQSLDYGQGMTATQKIIKEAESMTLEELAKKAIEESNGAMFYGLGNSSRGKTALPLFIDYLKTIDPNYNMDFEWQQPKNNKIFDQLTADSLKETGTFAMTLIQDGNQIQSKMVNTGILDTFIPKDWADANGTTADAYAGFLPLQTLNKVFMFNNTGDKTYDNCWDFVAEGEHGLYMDIDSEIVGKNFLYMLTHDTYATWLKEAYDKLPAEEKSDAHHDSDSGRVIAGGDYVKEAGHEIRVVYAAENAEAEHGDAA